MCFSWLKEYISCTDLWYRTDSASLSAIVYKTNSDSYLKDSCWELCLHRRRVLKCYFWMSLNKPGNKHLDKIQELAQKSLKPMKKVNCLVETYANLLWMHSVLYYFPWVSVVFGQKLCLSNYSQTQAGKPIPARWRLSSSLCY